MAFCVTQKKEKGEIIDAKEKRQRCVQGVEDLVSSFILLTLHNSFTPFP